MEELNILTQAKSQTIKLNDGKDYILAPLNLNTMADLEEAFGCSLAELGKRLFDGKGSSFTTLRKMLYVLLKSSHNLSIEQVGNLVYPSQLKEVSEAIMKVWTEK